MHHLPHDNDGHSYNASVTRPKAQREKPCEAETSTPQLAQGRIRVFWNARLDVITDPRRAQGCDRVFCHLNAVPLPTFILPHSLIH